MALKFKHAFRLVMFSVLGRIIRKRTIKTNQTLTNSNVLLYFQERKPGIKIPSAEWLRLQFQPVNSNTTAALRYTGRFNIRMVLQTRQMRVNHADAKYAYHQIQYGKEFAVKFRSHVRMICADDKAMVPVGEPGHPIGTGVRAHNRVLGSADKDTEISM